LVIIITLDTFQLNVIQIEYKNLFVYGLIFASALLVNRFIIHSVQKLLLMKNFGLTDSIILGVNRRGLDLYNTLQSHSHHGINVIGFIKGYDDPDNFDDNLPLPVLGHESKVHKIINEHNVNDLIIALDKPTSERVLDTIVNINGSPVSLKVVPDMYEVVMGMARTDQLVGVPLIDINLNIDTFYSKRLKRGIDILLSIIGLLILSPFWIFLMFIIKIDSRGPIFYLQERCGKNKKYFNIIKFRSMILDAEDKTGPVWADLEDNRITKVGKLLRRLHLDETPQLINILKGEMSIVGPRPERPYFIEKLIKEYPFYQRRLKIRPGITGWAQIKQPFDSTVKDVRQKLKYDFFYIENLSFRLDVKIIINTFWVVFWGHSR
jgi:exopolysaccharide biosynthesis polyprenyl glycosylphosphotransferase